MAGLKTYRAKRDFDKTPEPRGAATRGKGYRYVIQKHAARRLHYDLRLELDGVMLSWAVTRGPSLVPGDKRLAVHVEDHPIEYNKFEGTIPKGEYGGGTVMIWDRGTWLPEADPRKGMQKGHLDFELKGDKLQGRWHLVRMHKRPGERQEPWLLIKAHDDYARDEADPDILEQQPNSAATGRTMAEIAADKKKVWHSNKPAGGDPKPTVSPPPKAKLRPATTISKPAMRQDRRGSRTRVASRASVPDDKALAAMAGGRRARMPAFIEPCLATLSAKAPDTADWLHEIKFDGYRMQLRLEHGKATLKTRSGLNWTAKFPTIAQASAELAPHEAILDGEIVSTDAKGVSDFSALQDDLKSGRQDRLFYYVFDLLYLDGHDLRGAALVDRKRVLEQLLATLPAHGAIRYSEHFDIDGSRLLEHARRLHLEGIISKQRGAPYRSGRHDDWRKIKCADSQELVVVGFGPSDVAPKRVRALLLGYYDHGKLRYAGRVGTGFSDAQRDEFWRKLEPTRTAKNPFGAMPEEERGREVRWVEPRMVVEVDFRGWTGGGLVRQASFRGIREDKPARQVVRETPTANRNSRPKLAALRQKSPKRTGGEAPKRTGATAVSGVTLTHPDRVYWEDAGVTKAMLADYYTEVWERMRPYLANRVLALLRCPEGAAGECFFQKHASAGIDATRLKTVPEPGGKKSIAIDDLEGLISLVQAGVLEIHVRGSGIDQLEHADRLVFDLDPGPGVDWNEVIAAAREVRTRLQKLKLESFVKTTGGKGLHVVLPIRATPWDDAKDFCRTFAEQMAADNPNRYTATLKKSARDRRIFIDYLRNSREATAVAAYSTRARPGATVSTPLSWTELGGQKTPNFFTVLNLPQRLSRLRKDPWQGIERLKQRLPPTANARTTRRRAS
jgi:bifunctional non-homologous end joining protein LigD